MNIVGRYIAIVFVMLALPSLLMAQSERDVYELGPDSHEEIVRVPTRGIIITDDYADGTYTAGSDYSITVRQRSQCVEPNSFCIRFVEFDVAETDTLYVYDGASTDAPLLLKANNALNNPMMGRSMVFVSPANTDRTLTIRLYSADDSPTAEGFTCYTSCERPCETAYPVISPIYYRLQAGVVIDSAEIKTVVDDNGITAKAINLCRGESIRMRAHGRYSNYHGYYSPADSTSTFVWNMGIDRDEPMGLDTVMVAHSGELTTDIFTDTTGCYDVRLTINDEWQCPATVQASVRVRIAGSPIRTIASQLPTFCSNDSLRIVIGSERNSSSHLVLDTMRGGEVVSHTNVVKTFIPDGPECEDELGTICYQAPVVFTEFPDGMTITSKDDICSICINFEHSFMGDYDLNIVCPNGRKATLKYKDDETGELPYGAYDGGGLYTGLPYGGDEHDEWDNEDGHDCDSLYNMYGIGLDYCFSRNGGYTLVDGLPADTPDDYEDGDSPHYLGSGEYILDIEDYDFPELPRHFRTPDNGERRATERSFSTAMPSNYLTKSDYYKPADDFHTLIGCPLNGMWKIEICDDYGIDNGWVFSWTMDICNVNDNRECTYDVAIDSVKWRIDSSRNEYDGLRFRGLRLLKESDSISYAVMVDTAGTFPIYVSVFDNFGCRWDTSSVVHSVWAPQPKMSIDPKVYVCSGDSIKIKVSDPHANDFFAYSWNYSGSHQPTIITAPAGEDGEQQMYVATVSNNEDPSLSGCAATASVIVEAMARPLPSIDANIYPMEGCEPLTLVFSNHSQNVDTHRWLFSDGYNSNQAEPRHTFMSGVYDLRYYAYNSNGCADSIVMPASIHVYPQPQASFDWTPAIPLLSNPTAVLFSTTEPTSGSMTYRWAVQTVRDNPSSLTYVDGDSTAYTWPVGESLEEASFLVRHIVTGNHTGSTGIVYRCVDSTENNVVIVNDQLRFPNLVTPNGDGHNDVFVIVGLVRGGGYPVNSLDVYTRWGVRIFHTENINDESQFWDPAATHSPAGTYFFRFRGSGHLGVVDHYGTIDVVR